MVLSGSGSRNSPVLSAKERELHHQPDHRHVVEHMVARRPHSTDVSITGTETEVGEFYHPDGHQNDSQIAVAVHPSSGAKKGTDSPKRIPSHTYDNEHQA